MNPLWPPSRAEPPLTAAEMHRLRKLVGDLAERYARFPRAARQLLTSKEKAPTKRPTRRARPKCGAKTRPGRPCVAPAVWDPGAAAPRNGRCRNHGGLSTGPRTPEGLQRVAEALRGAREKKRLAKAAPQRPGAAPVQPQVLRQLQTPRPRQLSRQEFEATLALPVPPESKFDPWRALRGSFDPWSVLKRR